VENFQKSYRVARNHELSTIARCHGAKRSEILGFKFVDFSDYEFRGQDGLTAGITTAGISVDRAGNISAAEVSKIFGV